jgi:hypothetical protein
MLIDLLAMAGSTWLFQHTAGSALLAILFHAFRAQRLGSASRHRAFCCGHPGK